MLEHAETLRGFKVFAVDGAVGVVVDANQDGLLIRRRWLSWRRVTIPALAVSRVEMSDRAVWLDRSRRQVARIRKPEESVRQAWFFPASNRIPSGNPVIGPEPPRDEPSS
jgi:hypothetical protein